MAPLGEASEETGLPLQELRTAGEHLHEMEGVLSSARP